MIVTAQFFSMVTHNVMLPNIKEILNKHWHILSINSSFTKTLNNIQPMLAFCKNACLKQLIGTNTIRNNQKLTAPTQTATTGQCIPCYTRRSLYANKFSKQQDLEASKLERPLQNFTKSLAIAVMSSTY